MKYVSLVEYKILVTFVTFLFSVIDLCDILCLSTRCTRFFRAICLSTIDIALVVSSTATFDEKKSREHGFEDFISLISANIFCILLHKTISSLHELVCHYKLTIW